jgi:hypothetical protein
VTFELGRALLISGAVSVDSLAQALHAVVERRMPLPRALIEVGAIGERRLAEELARATVPVLKSVRPVPELMAQLPEGICQHLAAVPVRKDPLTGTVDVAVADALDPHPAHEIGYHLHAPVRVLRAPLQAIRDALEVQLGGVRALAPPMGVGRPTSAVMSAKTLIWGTPAVAYPDGNPAPPVSRRADALRVTGAWEDDSVGPDAPLPLKQRRVETEPIFELRRASVHAGPPSKPAPQFKPSSGPPPPAFPLRLPRIPKDAPASIVPIFSSRPPIAPNAPTMPFVDPATFFSGLKSASDRDAVVRLVLLGVRSVARKAGVLVVRKEMLVGWTCTPELGDEEAFRTIQISIATPSLLTTVLGGGLYLGPLLGAVALPFLRVMRSTTEDVAIAAVRVSGRPTLVIIADELGDTLLGTKHIEDLARAAGEALERIVRTRRG